PCVFWLAEAVDGTLNYVSRGFATVFGFPLASGSVRTAWVEWTHPSDREYASELFERARRGERAAGQFRIIRGDGATCWVEEEILPFRANGRLVRLAGTIRDVTAGRAVDEQMHAFRRLTESANDVFFLASPAENFRLKFINAAAERHFGRTVPE